MTSTTSESEELIRLTRLNLIPLYVVLTSLVWVLHDYLVTLEDEAKYMWRQKPSLGKFMFFWIRYYTIFLVAFDVLQIHSFAIPGVVSRGLCIATDPVTRLLGAISLWSIEIIMQLRIYILFRRSKKIAAFNAILFLISIGLFLWIMIVNAMRRKVVIDAIPQLPPLGCPSINGGSQWAQWVPAMLFEFVLFGFAAYKSIVSTAARIKLNERTSLTSILIHENILYFAVVGCLLVFNNLMVVGATRIPWFGFGPFHAALGITTGRMLMHLRKFATENLEGNAAMSLPKMDYVESSAMQSVDRPRRDIETNYEESDSDLDSVSDLSHDTDDVAGPSTRFAHT
jgi:hypothetical protein